MLPSPRWLRPRLPAGANRCGAAESRLAAESTRLADDYVREYVARFPEVAELSGLQVERHDGLTDNFLAALADLQRFRRTPGGSLRWAGSRPRPASGVKSQAHHRAATRYIEQPQHVRPGQAGAVHPHTRSPIDESIKMLRRLKGTGEARSRCRRRLTRGVAKCGSISMGSTPRTQAGGGTSRR